ncbi:MAG TPA: hypothetical protein PKH24_06765 [Sedimentisphaerales bacterium]|jgi:hypothetical protein|nr:hypothetical protein [Sedimentisphaerales bacterium]HNU28424.1 hypothetical protein [Sedimentisphaerales bacterium]
MALEAPLSKYKRHNFYIGMAVCIVMALWFGYDGHFNESFIKEHSDEQGKPNSTLVFNQKSPPFFVLGAILCGVYYCAIRNRKLVAADDALIIAGKQRIPYDAIEKIDKTHFEKKGVFTITYKNEQGGESKRTLSDREYDQLGPILDHLIAKIT